MNPESAQNPQRSGVLKFDIYTSDGRINPDKAFALIQEKMKELTPEEFCQIDSKPFEMRGVNRAVVRRVSAADSVSGSGAVVAKKKSTTKPARNANPKRSVGWAALQSISATATWEENCLASDLVKTLKRTS